MKTENCSPSLCLLSTLILLSLSSLMAGQDPVSLPPHLTLEQSSIATSRAHVQLPQLQG